MKTLSKEEVIAQRQLLDTMVHESLHLYFTQLSALTKIAVPDNPMVWDPAGDVGFAVVAFNHPNSPDMYPKDASEEDKISAITAVAAVLTPGVESSSATDNGLQGDINAFDVLPFGVQAVAATMMMSTMQAGKIAAVMKASQTLIQDRPDKEVMS